MDREKKYRQMVLIIQENSSMVTSAEKECTSGPMARGTLENGEQIKCAVLASTHGQMADSTVATG